MFKNIKHIIYFGLGIALAGLENILVFAVLVRDLAPNEYANISKYFLYSPLFGVALIVGVNSYVSVNYHKISRVVFYEKLGSLISFYVVMSIVALALTALYIIFGGSISFIYLLAICTGAALVPNLLLQAYYQTSLSSKRFFQIRSAVAFFDLLVVLFLLGSDYSGVAKIVAWLCALHLVTMIFMWLERSNISFAIRVADVKEALMYSLPLAPHLIIGNVAPSMDRLLSGGLMSDDAFAMYFTVFVFVSSALIAVEPINKFMAPYLFKILKGGNRNQAKRIILFYNLALSLFVFGIYWLMKITYPLYTGGRHLEGAEVMPILLLGIVFQGAYYGYVNVLFYYEKLRLVSRSTLVSFVISMFFMVPLIVVFGIYGAACSYLLYNVLLFINAYVYSVRELNSIDTTS